MKRSTNTAPVSLSTSYLMGSPCIGISMMTLQSFGRSLPAGTRSRFMAVAVRGAKRRLCPGCAGRPQRASREACAVASCEAAISGRVADVDVAKARERFALACLHLAKTPRGTARPDPSRLDDRARLDIGTCADAASRLHQDTV